VTFVSQHFVSSALSRRTDSFTVMENDTIVMYVQEHLLYPAISNTHCSNVNLLVPMKHHTIAYHVTKHLFGQSITNDINVLVVINVLLVG